MSRREPVTIYFSEAEKEDLKAEAEREGKTLSTYCYDLVQEKRREQAQEDVADRLDAEERLEQILAEGTDRLEEIAEDVREQQGLMIHILREIEDDLEGVSVDVDDADDVDGDGLDYIKDDDPGGNGP